MNQYVTPADIERYIKLHPSFSGSTEELASLANFFAAGPAITLSNFLYTQLVEEGNELYHGLQKHCRCGSCYEWQILAERDPETSVQAVLMSAESLTDWAK